MSAEQVSAPWSTWRAAAADQPPRSERRPCDDVPSATRRVDEGGEPRTGEEHLREVLRRRGRLARSQDPRPYDNDWGWWIEARIARLESGQTWLIRIAISALAAEILRIILVTTGVGS